jgi:hypothetical protein
MADSKTNLSPLQIATLIPPISPAWQIQGSYSSAALGLPPMGGRINSIRVPVPPGMGDAMQLAVNNVPMAPVIYGGNYHGLTAALRALPEVQSSWVRNDGFGVDVVFRPGSDNMIELIAMPVGAEVLDITEGVEVSSVLRASVFAEFNPLQASLVVQDLTFTATLAYRGVAGNALEVEYLVAGLGTALSVIVVGGTKISVNLATDGAGAPISTALEVLTAIQQHQAASRLAVAALTGNAATVQVAAGATALAGGAASTFTFRLWAMPSNRNAWSLVTATGPLTKPAGLWTSISTGIATALQQTMRLDLLVDSVERLYLEPVSISAGATLDVRIGSCSGA